MGGSKFMVGLVTAAGEVLCSQRRLWSELSPGGVVRDVKAAVRALLGAAALGFARIAVNGY
jgi:hypothetical protein